MLAHDIAGCFEEWLADQNIIRQVPRTWSLDEAILAWLKAEATYRTGKSYELYLRTVVIIVANWTSDRHRFVYQLDGTEVVLDELYAESYVNPAHPPWACLQRDVYERAVYMWREEHLWNKPQSSPRRGRRDRMQSLFSRVLKARRG